MVKFGETDSYSAGRWVHETSCFLLETCGNLVATSSFRDATEAGCEIAVNSRCKFWGQDENGDVLLSVKSEAQGYTNTVTFLNHLRYLS